MMIKRLVQRISSRFRSVQDLQHPVLEPRPQTSSFRDPPVGPDQPPRPVHAMAHGPSAPSDAADSTLPKVLEEELTRAVQRLVLRFAVSRESDAGRLLDSLMESREHIVRQPPLAAQRVLSRCRQTDAGWDEVIHLIETDPALTQDLIRHANSAFYATRSGRTRSLQAAVQRIGTGGVESVVMNRIAEGLVSRPGPPFDGYVDRVWFHMVRCAPLARRLAPAFEVESERAYTLALLHDVGKLVFIDFVAALRNRLRRAPRLDPSFFAGALVDIHQPLGGVAVSQWGFDQVSVVAIARHHRGPPPGTRCGLSEVVYLAERIDLARQRSEDVYLPRFWEDGCLTGSLDRASVLYDAYLQEQ